MHKLQTPIWIPLSGAPSTHVFCVVCRESTLYFMVKSFMPFMRNCFPFYGISGEVHLTFRDEAVLKVRILAGPRKKIQADQLMRFSMLLFDRCKSDMIAFLSLLVIVCLDLEQKLAMLLSLDIGHDLMITGLHACWIIAKK